MIDKSLLIIDDEKRMTDSLRDLLAAQNYKVDTANSGAAGIEALNNKAYPVVVTDLRMQGIDGLTVIRHIHENRPKTLIVVITGYASTESAIEALHYHAFDYLRKPFEFDQFKSVIERAFHRLEVDQLREDTAAMITHDIKVPLTSILGFAWILYDKEKQAFHPRGVEFAETIRANAQKILALIDNYLTTCKIDADNLVLTPTRIVLRSMVDDLLNTISVEAARQGFTIEAQVDEGIEAAFLDESYIYRAIGNLLQNAIKYGNSAEPVALNVRKIPASDSPLGADSIQLEVVNLAPEVRPETLDGLFGRFQRAMTHSGIEGSGIGLYVVEAVAKAHGGTAQASCLEGGRVSFSMLLPLVSNLEKNSN